MTRTKVGTRHGAALVLVTLALTACSQVPQMRGDIEGLSKIAEQAERNGAIRCAPRELAVAKSHLEFATVELDQGFVLRAREHLDVAEANAHAAYDLSPPAKCAERGFVEEKDGDCDADGIPDSADQCKCEAETYNGFQDDDGCPDDADTDGDGIPDSKDSCVLLPEDKDGYLDDDGCPDVDNDLDTIVDDKDKCPNDPEDPDGYEDADGCPEPDNDKDAVLDVDDQCPMEPGPANAEKPGCPKKSLVIVTDKEIKITQQIHFEFDKDKIRPESFAILDAVVQVLKENPSIMLEIQGHTDNKGAPAYNKSLSDRRAKSVKKYLVDKGKIDAKRLVANGYGMEKPLVPNTTDQNRALNRRVQFIRTEGGKR